MTILNYRPADDQFWIGCTYEEAEEMMLPLMDRDRILKYHELKRAYRWVLKITLDLFANATESMLFRRHSSTYQETLRYAFRNFLSSRLPGSGTAGTHS